MRSLLKIYSRSEQFEKNESKSISGLRYIISVIIFRILIDYSYIFFVHVYFAYSGFELNFSPVKYLESWIILIMVISIDPKCLNKVSDFIIVLITVTFLVPLLSYYAITDADRSVIYTILFQLLLTRLFVVGRPIKILSLSGGRKWSPLILFFFALSLTVYLAAVGGLRNFNLNILLVYEFRESASQTLNDGILGHLVGGMTKGLGPALLAFSVWSRNHKISIFLIGLYVLWFGITSHKSVIFIPLVIFGIYVFFKNDVRLFRFPFMLILVTAIALMAFLAFDSILLGSLILRRVFFIPAELTFNYFDFFASNQFIYWSNSLLSDVLVYPYDLSFPELMGNYTGRGGHANNSFFATSYMHAGFLGVIIYGIVFGIILKVIDSICYRSVPLWMGVAVVVIPLQIVIRSADLFTSLSSHGLILALFALFFLAKKNSSYGLSRLGG